MTTEVIIDNYMENLMRSLSVPEDKIKEQKALAKLLKALEKYEVITKEDGELLIKIGKDGGTIPELAEKLSMDRKELVKKLNDIFLNKGIVHPEPNKETGLVDWKPTSSLLLHDLVFINPKFQPDTHKELLDLLDEYYETGMVYVLGRSKKPLFRILPVNETISLNQTNIFPYEEVEKIINSAKKISLTDCVCRKRARRCNHPSEVCLAFDLAADMLIQRKFAKKITKEEALEVIKKSEESGLVHCVDNKQKGLYFICNCCSCACGVVRGAVVHGYRDIVNQSRYEASVDPEVCIGCETCIDKCQFDAITIEDGKSIINQNNCWGCGNCATNCPESAITLKQIRPQDFIPEKGESFMGF
ncbi:MAG: 4Fe-4S binding protein [Candidatus Helarchaeota archaeon]|nr:4Fe-4S binding protein [Candidatus Helarchaeota archaeon]